jgi:hypothetical protein
MQRVFFALKNPGYPTWYTYNIYARIVIGDFFVGHL